MVGYCVVVFEVPAKVPPQDAVYQYHAAPVPKTPPVSVSTLAVPGHTVKGTAVTVVGTVEIEFIEIVILRQLELLQPVNCHQL